MRCGYYRGICSVSLTTKCVSSKTLFHLCHLSLGFMQASAADMGQPASRIYSVWGLNLNASTSSLSHCISLTLSFSLKMCIWRNLSSLSLSGHLKMILYVLYSIFTDCFHFSPWLSCGGLTNVCIFMISSYAARKFTSVTQVIQPRSNGPSLHSRALSITFHYDQKIWGWSTYVTFTFNVTVNPPSASLLIHSITKTGHSPCQMFVSTTTVCCLQVLIVIVCRWR